MIPQSIVFTVSTQCTLGESTSKNMDTICENLVSELSSNNPNIQVQWVEIESDLDFISAELIVRNITKEETLHGLIADIKSGRFDADYHEYSCFTSQP
jgi:hypothetical protein